MNGLARQQPA
jgi:hypothetical protein